MSKTKTHLNKEVARHIYFAAIPRTAFPNVMAAVPLPHLQMDSV
jgi:hypothetical protein